jgi:hypothetical protein
LLEIARSGTDHIDPNRTVSVRPGSLALGRAANGVWSRRLLAVIR